MTLAQVIEAALRRLDPQETGPRFKAAALAEAIEQWGELARLREAAKDGAWLAWLCRHPDRTEPAELGWPEMTAVLDRLEASPEMAEVVP